MVNNKNLSSSANYALQRFAFWVTASINSRRFPVKSTCTLDFTAKTANNQGTDGESTSPRESLKKVLLWSVASFGNLCNTEGKRNEEQQSCIEISESTLTDVWTKKIIGFVFMTIFPYIGLGVICLYSATVDTHERISKITVEGPSPVGLRSLIGNYFFSSDRTMWHMVRKFIMRVFILPLPFLVPAIFVEYLLYQTMLSQQITLKERTHLFQPFRVICYCCYCIQAFYLHFIIGKTKCSNSYVGEWSRENKHLKFIWTCSHQELPQRRLTLIRVVWDALVMYWDLFLKLIPSYQDIKHFILSFFSLCHSCEISVSYVLWIIFFNLWVSLSVVLLSLIFLITYALGYIFIFPLLSSPVSTLCTSANFRLWQLVNINFPRRFLLLACFVVVLLDICLSCLAAIGVMSVLKYSAIGIMIFLQLAVTYMLCEENLLFLTFCGLVCCYLWSCYRSFTQKYQDVAVELFEQYNQLTESPCKTDFNMQVLTSDYGRTVNDVKRIPKTLFDMACEELMPVRKSICIMVLKATLSVIFVMTVFSFALLLNALSLTRTLLTLADGSFPKIVIMWIERRKLTSQLKHQAVTIDERVRKVVHEFINISSPCDQEEKHLFGLPYNDEMKEKETCCDLFVFFVISITVYFSFCNIF